MKKLAIINIVTMAVVLAVGLFVLSALYDSPVMNFMFIMPTVFIAVVVYLETALIIRAKSRRMSNDKKTR